MLQVTLLQGVRVAVQSALAPGEDPRLRARVLRRTRDEALSGGVPSVAPRDVISASWKRMRWTSVDPGGAPALALLGAGELQRRRDESGLAVLLPLLRERLLPAAEAAGQIMVVVDPGGRVLWREGGPDVRRRADALGFMEGSAWDEASVGTNAIGTSLVEGAPVHVYAAEHYAETHQPWTCAAAPLHDPVTGRLLGAVDLSGPAHTVHASTVALVDAVARLVELEVRARHDLRLHELRAVGAPLLARVGGRALLVGQDGTTAGATGMAAFDRVVLPSQMSAGTVWLPALGRCLAEALPGGWLLRLDEDLEAPPTELVVDLSRSPFEVSLSGPSGRWSHVLTARHADILASLVQHPEGRSAAELAQDLFGDPTRTVTVRAEVSRLRRSLGPLLVPQPYRFAAGVRARLVLPPG